MLKVDKYILSYIQVVGRGNDQVAISSKFETREDPGMFHHMNSNFSY